MVRKTSSSQDFRDIVDTAEQMRAAASVLHGSLEGFIKACEGFDERVAGVAPRDLLSQVFEALGPRAHLLPIATGVNTKVLRSLETSLSAFLEATTGLTSPASAGDNLPAQPPMGRMIGGSGRNVGEFSASAPASTASRVDSAAPASQAPAAGGKAPKAQPDRLKNFMGGFNMGAEAKANGTYDPAEEDRKGYTARGYKAGGDFYQRTGKTKGTLLDMLPVLIEELIEAGKAAEAEEMRQLLAEHRRSLLVDPDAGSQVPQASVAGAPAVAPTSSDQPDQSGEDKGVHDGANHGFADGSADGAGAAPNPVVESPPLDGDIGVGVDEEADEPFTGSPAAEGEADGAAAGDGQAQAAGSDAGAPADDAASIANDIPEFLRRS
ncbi:MAG: hypothetical protein K2X45_02045 [Phreatobacter sp.]|nr:hypothetical protein [Phreatobacter sp.]